MKGKFDAVTFRQNSLKLNSRPVYWSQLYGNLGFDLEIAEKFLHGI